MSIFDKYNANPYITTYAGAPIKEYQQTASALQQRMDQNIAQRDQIEIMMNDIEASNVDEDFKKSKIAEYQKALEEISENPEYATSKVRSLSKKFKMDEDFKEMKQSKDRITKLQEEIREGDYSDFQTRKFTDALRAYQTPDEEGKAGLAAGRSFGDVNFYEEVAINEKVDDQVKGILGEKYGSAQLDPVTGMISTVEGDITSEERVRGSILGALYGNKQVSRQLNDEAKYRFEQDPAVQNLPPEERAEAYNEYFKEYVENTYVNPALAKFVRGSEKTGLKGGGSGSGSGSSGGRGAAVMPITSIDRDMVQTSALTQDVPMQETISNYYDLGKQVELGEFETGSQLDKAVNTQKLIEGSLRTTLANENIVKDPELRNFLANEDDITKLFDIIRPQGDIDALNMAVQQLPGLDSDWTDPEVKQRYDSILNDIKETHGEEISNKVGIAMFPNYTMNDARKAAIAELVETDPNYTNAYRDQAAIVKDPRYSALKLKHQEQIQKQRMQELREEYPTLSREAFPTAERTARYLRSRGYDEDKLGKATRLISNIIDDGGFTRSYQDNMKDGLADVGVNRSSVNIESLFKDEGNRKALVKPLLKAFNYQDLDLSDFESFKVRDDEGRLTIADADTFDGYQLDKMEITEVDNMGGFGLINVEVPPVTGSDEKLPLKLSVDISNPRFTDVRNKITSQALRKAEVDPSNKEIFMGIAHQYQGKETIMQLNEYSSEIAEGMNLTLTDDYLTAAFGGPITFEKDDSGFTFYDNVGNALFPSGKSFENSNLAYQALREKAAAKFSQGRRSLTKEEA